MHGADGYPLRGEVRTSGSGRNRPAIVICHGFKGFKDWGFFPVLAERLARAGFTAVSFNFSSSGVGPDGESFSELDRFGHGTYGKDLHDIGTVVSALETGTLCDALQPVSAYGMLGHSRGGGTAALHTAVNRAVRALVTWAGIARTHRWDSDTVAHWRDAGKVDVVNARTGDVLPLYTDLLDDLETRGSELDVLNAAGQIEADWLIVHGAADESVPVEEARALHAAAPDGRAKLLVVPDGGHTFGAQHPWSGSTSQLDIVIDATVGWFADHLF